jgi:two-component system chemotaxis sensor kinase CheA
MSGKTSEDNLRNVYFTESRELLDSMETSLLSLERESSDQDSINSVFRAVHTIKGNSGMFGYRRIGDFSHVLENLLVCVRNGSVGVTPEMTALFLECHDFIQMMLDHYENEKDAPLGKEMETLYSGLIFRMNSYLPQDNTEGDKQKTARERVEAIIARPSACAKNDGITVCNDCWHISLRFGECFHGWPGSFFFY